MSYLHCHNCNWEQDDFWHYHFNLKDWKEFFTLKWQHRPFGYNPESILLEDIGTWLYPRKIQMDIMWAKERDFDTDKICSWWLLKESFKRYFKVRKNMVWKTFKAFKKDYNKGKAFCPKCGSSKDFDID